MILFFLQGEAEILLLELQVGFCVKDFDTMT
jgi:hypothetical protein